LFALAPELDRTEPSLGAMEAFFSLGAFDEAGRRAPFVQQICSSAAGGIAKVHTMPAEPILPVSRAAAPAAAGRRTGGRMSRSTPW
jgi:hypothetical protein